MASNRDLAKVSSRPGGMYNKVAMKNRKMSTMNSNDEYGIAPAKSITADPSLADLKATYIDNQGTVSMLEKGRQRDLKGAQSAVNIKGNLSRTFDKRNNSVL